MSTGRWWVRFDAQGCAVSSCSVSYGEPAQRMHRPIPPGDYGKGVTGEWTMRIADVEEFQALQPCLQGTCTHRSPS
jgi:hypothetical protein